MSEHSNIEWTDATWNPTRGCVKVSPGCKYCYAETFAERFRGAYQRNPRTKLVIVGDDGAPVKHPYHEGFDPRLVPEALDAPLRWKAPRTIFVNSMSDLFGEFVPNEFIAAVFGVMAATPRHTFQLLTKRAERLPDWFEWLASAGASMSWPLPNVWLGVSVEDRKYGLPRIEHLRRTPAAVRFLSIEPLLEDIGTLDLTGIHWVIVGGESGNGARPMNPYWARSIRDQCVAAKVPFFFKQFGEYSASEPRKASDPPTYYHRVGKKAAGRLLDGRTWDEMPLRST